MQHRVLSFGIFIVFLTVLAAVPASGLMQGETACDAIYGKGNRPMNPGRDYKNQGCDDNLNTGTNSYDFDQNTIIKCLCWAHLTGNHQGIAFYGKLAGGSSPCSLKKMTKFIQMGTGSQSQSVQLQGNAGAPNEAVEIQSGFGGAIQKATSDAQGNFTVTFQVTVSPSNDPGSGITYTMIKPPECNGVTAAVPVKRKRDVYVVLTPHERKKPLYSSNEVVKFSVHAEGSGDIDCTIYYNSDEIWDGKFVKDFARAVIAGEGGTVLAECRDQSHKTDSDFFKVRILPQWVDTSRGSCVVQPTGHISISVYFDFDNPSKLPVEARVIARYQGVTGENKASGKGERLLVQVTIPTEPPEDAKDIRVLLRYGAYYNESDSWTNINKKKRKIRFNIQNPKRHIQANAGIAQTEVPCDFCDDCLADKDGDGIDDLDDNCPEVANADQADFDGDEVGDACDNCPDHPNFDQENGDGDDFGDVCDYCPEDPFPTNEDEDGDEVGDICDNCPSDFNPDQYDTDSDELGDKCDNCPKDANPDQADADGDLIGDVCEDDVCEPPECCEEYPVACGGNCYEACAPGTEMDMVECVCVEIVDTYPPLVTIVSPAHGTIVPGGSSVTVQVTFVDNGKTDTGVVSGTFTVSGEGVAGGPSPASFTTDAVGETTEQFTFTVAPETQLGQVADLGIVVTARATDAEGNQSGPDVSHLSIEPPCLPPECCVERPLPCGPDCLPSDWVCCAGGTHFCGPGYPCCGPACCPQGTTCCNDSACCKSGEECCGTGCCGVNAYCCPDGVHCCPLGQACCPSAGGCCDGTCCGPVCCPPGTVCVSPGICSYQ